MLHLQIFKKHMNRVRLIRTIRNISLRELAKQVQCSVGTIHAIEEEFNRPNVILARRIADILEADLGLLFPDEEVYYDDRITFYLQCKMLSLKGRLELGVFEVDWLDQEFPTLLKMSEVERLFAEQEQSESYAKFLSLKKKKGK